MIEVYLWACFPSKKETQELFIYKGIDLKIPSLWILSFLKPPFNILLIPSVEPLSHSLKCYFCVKFSCTWTSCLPRIHLFPAPPHWFSACHSPVCHPPTPRLIVLRVCNLIFIKINLHLILKMQWSWNQNLRLWATLFYNLSTVMSTVTHNWETRSLISFYFYFF